MTNIYLPSATRKKLCAIVKDPKSSQVEAFHANILLHKSINGSPCSDSRIARQLRYNPQTVKATISKMRRVGLKYVVNRNIQKKPNWFRPRKFDATLETIIVRMW